MGTRSVGGASGGLAGAHDREIALQPKSETRRCSKHPLNAKPRPHRQIEAVPDRRSQKELQDGGLILSAKVGHLNAVLPIVRYWIPHIRIISPEGLQSDLERELGDYLQR